MSGIEMIGAISGGVAEPAALRLGGVDRLAVANPAAPASFSQMMTAGLRSIDAKIDTANALVRQFAVDDSVPVHQVTMALEEARLSVELAMHVRTRLVDGYREIMNMQL